MNIPTGYLHKDVMVLGVFVFVYDNSKTNEHLYEFFYVTIVKNCINFVKDSDFTLNTAKSHFQCLWDLWLKLLKKKTNNKNAVCRCYYNLNKLKYVGRSLHSRSPSNLY